MPFAMQSAILGCFKLEYQVGMFKVWIIMNIPGFSFDISLLLNIRLCNIKKKYLIPCLMAVII